jgi:hypothetical protein
MDVSIDGELLACYRSVMGVKLHLLDLMVLESTFAVFE